MLSLAMETPAQESACRCASQPANAFVPPFAWSLVALPLGVLFLICWHSVFVISMRPFGQAFADSNLDFSGVYGRMVACSPAADQIWANSFAWTDVNCGGHTDLSVGGSLVVVVRLSLQALAARAPPKAHVTSELETIYEHAVASYKGTHSCKPSSPTFSVTTAVSQIVRPAAVLILADCLCRRAMVREGHSSGGHRAGGISPGASFRAGASTCNFPQAVIHFLSCPWQLATDKPAATQVQMGPSLPTRLLSLSVFFAPSLQLIAPRLREFARSSDKKSSRKARELFKSGHTPSACVPTQSGHLVVRWHLLRGPQHVLIR